RLETFLVREHCRHVEMTKPLDSARRAFNSAGVGNRATEHLETAAKAEDHPATPPMRRNIAIKTGGPQRRETGDGRLRARQDDEIGSAGKRSAWRYAHELDVGPGLQRIEIVEIGDVRQDRHGNAHAPVRPASSGPVVA